MPVAARCLSTPVPIMTASRRGAHGTGRIIMAGEIEQTTRIVGSFKATTFAEIAHQFLARNGRREELISADTDTIVGSSLLRELRRDSDEDASRFHTMDRAPSARGFAADASRRLRRVMRLFWQTECRNRSLLS